jgi:hypothetical protein
MTTALLVQRQWAVFGAERDLFTILNPLRYFHIWNNTWIMDTYINRKLDERYLTSNGSTHSKTIIDLALNDYAKETASTQDKQPIDAPFRKYANSNLKVFIFAGHDAVSSTICYAWLLLSRHPHALNILRAEHDAVLGPEEDAAAEKLLGQPALINQLPYTLAVIKETLRLFPAVSSPRKGQQNFILTDSQGRQFPTEGCLVWAGHHGVHNNPLFWSRAEECLPERFLPDASDELRPPKNAWRPFEWGPRACIGTELALAEIKVAFALTARSFDLEEAYDEWDRVNNTKGTKTVDGERAYQIQLGSAHPADGFPVRVKLRGA